MPLLTPNLSFRHVENQAEEENTKVDLSTKGALHQSIWIVGINVIATRLRLIWPTSLVVGTIRFNTLVAFFWLVL